MGEFHTGNPVFVTWMIATALTVLKVMGQGWMTVFRMMKINAGLVSPEDLRPGPANRNPRSHEVRAAFYTVGSLIVMAMAVYALVAVV